MKKWLLGAVALVAAMACTERVDVATGGASVKIIAPRCGETVKGSVIVKLGPAGAQEVVAATGGCTVYGDKAVALFGEGVASVGPALRISNGAAEAGAAVGRSAVGAAVGSSEAGAAVDRSEARRSAVGAAEAGHDGLVGASDMRLVKQIGLDRWFQLYLEEDADDRAVAMRLAARADVECVQFETLLGPIDDGAANWAADGRDGAANWTSDGAASDGASSDGASDGLDGASDGLDGLEAQQRDMYRSPIPFNDELNNNQWNLVNTGNKRFGETTMAGADVNVAQAWNLTAGSKDVVVAVIDDAIKFIHEDLSDAMWVNEAELNGEYGVDDDGNGYIDDKYGFNFFNAYSKQVNGKEVWSSSEGLIAKDGFGHATHIAGIIGATNNNGIGVSSIAGGTGAGDGVRLMSLQIYRNRVPASDKKSAQAFIYAADNGACIANCSFGTPGGEFLNDEDYINGNNTGIGQNTGSRGLEYEAMQYFLRKANSPVVDGKPVVDGNIIVCSAGNEGKPYASYPGAFPFCIAVTATGPDGLPSGYTNYGPGCNIAAPGGDFGIGVLAPYGANKSQIFSTGVREASGQDYVWMQGSSMAAPHVAGVAALGISYAQKLAKHFSREEFISMLLTSVNDINGRLEGSKLTTDGTFKPDWSANPKTINLVDYYGKMGTGSIDAWKLLMNVEGIPSFIVRRGEVATLDLNRVFFEGAAALEGVVVEPIDGAAEALGLEAGVDAGVEAGVRAGDGAGVRAGDGIVIKNGCITFKCNKIGSGKFRISGSIGKDTSRPDGMKETKFSREIAIASRNIASTSGGWF